LFLSPVEKIMQVFDDVLKQDPLYEVVQASHGYTLLGWQPCKNQWYSAELLETPEAMLDALVDAYASYLEDTMTAQGERDELTPQEREDVDARCRQLREKCLAD
jgi:hypothetical protein